jgi:ATP-dependent Clp protease ATP-binding subunit ClpA
VIQEHVKKPLAEEVLFGRLAKGGTVLVDIADGKLTFSYLEAKAPGGRGKGSAAKKASGKSPETVG